VAEQAVGLDRTTVRAPAKLTLSLRITGVRADGYHLIDAEMVTLDWADTLTIQPGGRGLTVSGPFADGVPLDRRNLVGRALQLCGRNAAVHIDKQLPHGGGLGGGSSDAAAVLRWAGYGDVAGAVALGADVPFCLVGGRARVTGIGEIVEPLDHRDLPVTLVVPPLSVSTPAVYRAWDTLPRAATADAGNQLEPAALLVEPRLAHWRDRIHEACGIAPALAGSGATWFVLGHHPVLSEALAGDVVVLTRTDRPRRAVGDERTTE
jgi:4-diphosphocytidyl-2-C-methyl-D-erythritol kinase